MGQAGYKGGPLEVTVNPDQLPLPVEIDNFEAISFTSFDEDNAVVTATRTSVILETAVAGVFEKCAFIPVSGSVFALWELERNGVVIQALRTSPNLNDIFEFKGTSLDLTVGDTLEVFVTHTDPTDQDFQSTIYGFA